MKFLKALFVDEDFSEQSFSADSLNFCGELQLKSELPVLEVAVLRDDLKAAISRLSASSFFSQARFRELLPAVTLKSEVFRTSENLEKAFGSDYAGFSNLLIEVPIFDIQSKLVAVFKGKLLEEEAVHALNDKLNSVMSEIFWSINLINLSSTRLRLLETALEDFSQIKEISDQRLQAGLISVFDWYDTEKTFFEIEASRINSQMLYWVAWLTILKNVPNFDDYFIFS
jgi:outer membrane protein TolC